jgi:polyferredoxin
MRSTLLRRTRIVVSTVFLICFFMLFIDLRHLIPVDYISKLTYLQFLPSVVNFIHLKSLAAAGFIIVLLLTLVTGRTYCSFLCPLGIGQDLFSRIGGRIRKKFRRYGYKKPFTIFRYTLLMLTLAAAMVWGIPAITLIDPYNIFGRFMTFFAKPLVILINNLFAGILGKLDIYSLSNIPLTGFPIAVYSIPAAFFILVGTLSFTKGRLFCNMICPAGTFLGLISKISVIRLKFDGSACTRCGRCAVACKSSCIDFLNSDIDITRCVDCFNCVHICQDNAISYGLVSLKRKSSETDESKRRVLIASMLFLFGLPGAVTGQEKKLPGLKRNQQSKRIKPYRSALPERDQ